MSNKKIVNAEILLELQLEIKHGSNLDQVVQEIHDHVYKYLTEDFNHFEGIEVNDEYSISVVGETEIDLNSIKDMVTV